MREDPVSRLATLLVAPDPKLSIRRADSDLIRGKTRKLHAQNDCVNRFTKIDRRCPGFRRQRFFRDGGFLQSSEQAPHAIA
jgi:hypothetical protein